MDDNFSFQKIEDTKTIDNNTIKDEEIKEAFVTGLPDWDLEPPYEMLNRGNNE